jgi:hypothetical protein
VYGISVHQLVCSCQYWNSVLFKFFDERGKFLVDCIASEVEWSCGHSRKHVQKIREARLFKMQEKNDGEDCELKAGTFFLSPNMCVDD